MFKINQNTSCITSNCIHVSYIVTINTYNVSIVRIKLARSTIGSSEVECDGVKPSVHYALNDLPNRLQQSDSA